MRTKDSRRVPPRPPAGSDDEGGGEDGGSPKGKRTTGAKRRGSSFNKHEEDDEDLSHWEARPIEDPPPAASDVYDATKAAIHKAKTALLSAAEKAKEELAAQTYTKDLKRRLVDATEKCFKQERALKNAKHAAVWKPTTGSGGPDQT